MCLKSIWYHSDALQQMILPRQLATVFPAKRCPTSLTVTLAHPLDTAGAFPYYLCEWTYECNSGYGKADPSQSLTASCQSDATWSAMPTFCTSMCLVQFFCFMLTYNLCLVHHASFEI